jgi:Neuraminidase (sialidase)
MRHWHRLRALAPLAVMMVVLAVARGGLVQASPSPTLVSGPSPFASCRGGGSDTTYVNAEVEPRVAVNPTDPTNIVGVFQQDRRSDGGASGLVAGVSHDGGTSWAETWAHFSACAGGTATNGGTYDLASDPWVTFAQSGAVYQISLSASADLVTSAILVSKSTNGGDTWSEPTTLIRDSSAISFNDKESITADPTNAADVYAVWDRSRFPSENANLHAIHPVAIRGDIFFARTTNGGASWEAPRNLLTQNKDQFTIGNQIVVLPNGTLVDIFNLGKGSGIQPSDQYFQAVIRSTDQGVTWSQPIIIAQDRSVAVTDPDTGAQVRSGALPDIAVDRTTGTLYAVWADGRWSLGAHDDIALSRSTDGGLTWSAPVKVNQTTNNAAAFTPAVYVAANGTVGVTSSDFRNNTAAAGVPTDSWLVRCPATSGDCTNPANWSETHVAGPFDIETAPVAQGYFLGDYAGLTTVGSDFNTFLPFFVQTNTGNTRNQTDVFTTTI